MRVAVPARNFDKLERISAALPRVRWRKGHNAPFSLRNLATWRACEVGLPIALGGSVASPFDQTAARSRTMNSIISAVTRSACCSGGAPTEMICGTTMGEATGLAVRIMPSTHRFNVVPVQADQRLGLARSH